jgi:hypothetical protein
MRKMNMSRDYVMRQIITLADGSRRSVFVDFNFTEAEPPQYYERHGRAPDPGCPSELEVTKLVGDDMVEIPWESISEDERESIEEACGEYINMLAGSADDPR